MPDLREPVIVLGVIGAGLKAQNSRVRLSRTLRAWVKQHLAGLARPADRLPFKVVEMAHFVRSVVLSRRFARRRQFRIGIGRVGNFLARDSAHLALPFAVLSGPPFRLAILLHHSTATAD